MGLFGKLFEKKECSICGGEIGLLGNRKLEDGNSTVVQIREQLAYRETNARDLADFQVTRTIGEAYKMYIEEVDGVPTRFFVTDAKEYMEKNPDISEITIKRVLAELTADGTIIKVGSGRGTTYIYNRERE